MIIFVFDSVKAWCRYLKVSRKKSCRHPKGFEEFCSKDIIGIHTHLILGYIRNSVIQLDGSSCFRFLDLYIGTFFTMGTFFFTA